MTRYYEDLEVGTVRDLGSVTVPEGSIVAFGERWDPLDQHTDAGAATDSLAGGLVASGLHTVCLSNRLAVEGFREAFAGVVGLGFDDLRFPAPVRPGDTVSFSHEVTDARPSASDAEVGVVTTRITGETETAGLVVGYTVTMLVERQGDPIDDEARGQQDTDGADR